jgi:hypothetical protein
VCDLPSDSCPCLDLDPDPDPDPNHTTDRSAVPFRTKEGKAQHFLALGTCVVEGEDTSARGRVILLDIYKATIVHASANATGETEGEGENGATGTAASSSSSTSSSATAGTGNSDSQSHADSATATATTKSTQLRAQTFLTRKEKGPVTAMCAFDNAKTGERMLGTAVWNEEDAGNH